MNISKHLIVIIILSICTTVIPTTHVHGDVPQRTRIISPANNSEVHGLVVVKAEVMVCNDTYSFALYVDDYFISNGTLDEKKGIYSRDNISYYLWNYMWNTKDFSNGVHIVWAHGAHEYYDEIEVYVKNQGEKKIPRFETSSLIGLIGICLIISEIKRFRSSMPRTSVRGS